MTIHHHYKGLGNAQLGGDAARASQGVASSDRNQVMVGRVGHEDPNPLYIRMEAGQPWVEVTMEPEGDEIVARLAVPAAGPGTGWYMPLEFGCRVIMEAPDGDPQRAVIVGRMWDENCAFPGSVAGVSTFADGATGDVTLPAPAWSFQKLPDGSLLAIETGTNGDILIHAGSSVHIKAGGLAGAIHMDGQTHLGLPPSTPPVGATVGPDGITIPGLPAVPAVPLPYVGAGVPEVPPVPQAPPYVGFNDGIIRAKDAPQSNITVDLKFWAWVGLVSAGLPTPIVSPAIPTSLTSVFTGTGSKHTASD